MKNPLNNPNNDRLAFTELKYRIENEPYSKIAAAMAKAGLTDTALKILLFRGFNVRVEPMTDPTIYFSVTEETMRQIAQDMGPTLKKRGRGSLTIPDGVLLPDGKSVYSTDKLSDEQGEQILALKIGSSTSLALTEDYAKTLFLARTAEHNAS